jgi:hypothetical protein
MLPGSGQLVEESGLPAVLVAHEGKCQKAPLRKRRTGPSAAVFIHFTQTGVVGFFCSLSFGGRLRGSIDAFNINLFRVRKAECEFIAMEPQFHRVAHGSQLDQRDFHSRDYAHIQKMLAERSFAAYFFDYGTLAGFQITDCHLFRSFYHSSALEKARKHSIIVRSIPQAPREINAGREIMHCIAGGLMGEGREQQYRISAACIRCPELPCAVLIKRLL